jgi:hypothetical protein
LFPEQCFPKKDFFESLDNRGFPLNAKRQKAGIGDTSISLDPYHIFYSSNLRAIGFLPRIEDIGYSISL